MGNINNPCVNRWGLNTFWNHYWYSDTKYALFLQQDSILTLLIKTYITYGGHPALKSYRNSYWIHRSHISHSDRSTRDYRHCTVHEKELNYFYRFRLRLESAERFESQWVVLRFNHWVVLSISWFQPDKQLNKRLKKSAASNLLISSSPNVNKQAVQALRTSRLASLVHHSLLKSPRVTAQPYLF